MKTMRSERICDLGGAAMGVDEFRSDWGEYRAEPNFKFLFKFFILYFQHYFLDYWFCSSAVA